MKIITKKSVIFAALAVVLLATALVISCNSPLDGISDKEEPSKPGTGKVKLTINTRNASRTILPVSATPTDTKYLVVLTGDGTPALPDQYINVTPTGATQTLNNIPIGTYTKVQVIVYVNATAFAPASDTFSTFASSYAIGESSAISASYNVNGTTPTNLGTHNTALYIPGATTGYGVGTGSFSYNITNSANRLASAEFVVLGRGGVADLNSGSAFVISSFGSEVSVGTSIPTGYYNVIFTIEDDEANIVNFFEILHVYKNLKSLYTSTFVNSIFPDPTNPPTDGDGNIIITQPGLPTVTIALSTDDTTNVTIVNSSTVNIKKGVARNLTITATPTGTVSNPVWVNGANVAISMTNGISSSASGQVYTITFDTTNGGTNTGFPLDLLGNPNVIQLTLEYTSNGAPLVVPPINIRFQD